AWPAPARGVTRRSRGRVPPARMATPARAGTAPGSAWAGRSLSSSLTGGGRWRMRARRKAVGFAHGLRGFGGTVEVCSGEVPSGWYLPSVHREGLATVLVAVVDGDADGRGDRAEVTQLGADAGRLRAHVTPAHPPLGPGGGVPGGDGKPVDHNGHLLGRRQSFRTRPALDGPSARCLPRLADPGRPVKRLSGGNVPLSTPGRWG